MKQPPGKRNTQQSKMRFCALISNDQTRSAGMSAFWLQSIVTLHDSDKYKFVVVEDFGIVSQYAPRTIRGDIQTMVYVS